jgi:CRP-like cAMP-binding protein
MDSDPAFATRWIGMLNREVKRLRLQCERLALNKVQDRLLHLLETEGQNGKYPLGSGLKSLARELGVTHEALYRCVSDMEKSNLVTRDGGYLSLSVRDGEGLK